MAGAGSPCGACKFLRRKCTADCIFAPHFCSESSSSASFAAIHRIFGASNASKLLHHVPDGDRGEAAITIAYEAQARLSDPVHGCVAHIIALQQQVAILQAQLVHARAQLAYGAGLSQLAYRNSCPSLDANNAFIHVYSNGHSMALQSSLVEEALSAQISSKKRTAKGELQDLQLLAVGMSMKRCDSSIGEIAQQWRN
ncbi:LOB domain-containing protein 16 [Dendrobium catenatum]|uniref:LOB domain-containing protein 16 n=1 Tax=Dendrobium catenatum TaxID=906689 RepID=A0A2I0X4N7_9ASPA|nr:LOB domain-containing protein 16 [Dendrobium catenatum]